MKKILLLLCLSLFIVSQAYAQRRGGKGPTIKTGLFYSMHSGSSVKVIETTGSTSESYSNTLTGTQIYGEYILMGRFGIGLKYGQLLRESDTFNLTISGTTNTYRAKETVTTTLLEVKTYFKDHSGPGIKPHLGVTGFPLGTYSSSISLDITPAGGSTSTESPSVSVPVVGLSGGVDWILDFAGVRGEIVYMTGKVTDTDSVSGYEFEVSHGGLMINIAAYLFF